MKISQAFRTAYKTVAGQKAETAKLLATEFALTVMCLAPLLFLTAKGPEKYCAVLALPLWLLVKVPSRLNAAAVMQDGLEEGKLFSLRMGDPGNYRAKLRYALIRLGLLLLWAAPLIAALLYAWEKYTGRTDGLTVLQMHTRKFVIVAFAGATGCASLAMPWVQKLLGNPLTRFLCAISYQVYLWHAWVALRLKDLHIPSYQTERPMDGPAWRFPYLMLSLAITLAIAIAVTYLIERPVHKCLAAHAPRWARPKEVQA